jgi:hypothetical protein
MTLKKSTGVSRLQFVYCEVGTMRRLSLIVLLALTAPLAAAEQRRRTRNRGY